MLLANSNVLAIRKYVEFEKNNKKITQSIMVFKWTWQVTTVEFAWQD